MHAGATSRDVRPGTSCRVLQQGCEAPEAAKAAGPATASHGHGGGGDEDGGLANAVRPGALLYSIDIIRHEMEINPPAAAGAPTSAAAVQRRLAEIKDDAVHVVRSIRDGKLAHLSPKP